MHISAGFLFVYSVGPSVSYVTLCILGIILSGIFLLSFYFMPESPCYFLLRGDYHAASQSLQILRNKPEEEVKEELSVMQVGSRAIINKKLF